MNFEYFDHIKELLETVIKEEKSGMEKAVALLSDAILKKQAIFAFGASHAGILCEELYYRAGGLVLINPIFGKEIMLDVSPITRTSQMERLSGYGETLMKGVPMKSGDVLIVHSVSGRNAVTVEIAIEAKKRGASVIALTNLAYSQSVESRHPSKLRLFETSDIVLDNHGDIGDACVRVEGLEQKVGPTSTVIGAAILNSIIAETVQELKRRGMEKPPIFYSANLDGGDELNQAIFEKYQEQIHYRF